MASKYAHLIHKLPRILGTEPAHQLKVDVVKNAMVNDPEFKRTATALCRQYAELRTFREHTPLRELLAYNADWGKKSLKEVMSELQVQIDAVEQLMVEQYEVEGTTSMNLDTGENIRVQTEPYAKVEDKEAFRRWSLKNGFELDMHLLWAKTNSLVKEILLNGEPEPDGVKAKAINKVFLTRNR